MMTKAVDDSSLERALECEPTEITLKVRGRSVHALVWGEPANQPIVLVHGGAAHAWWWSLVAPFFIDDYYVVALDLSGHGDSEWRDHYLFDTWCAEISAFLDAVPRGHLDPILIGHSMGGIVATVAASLLPDVAGLISIDSPLRDPEASRLGNADDIFARRKFYETEQSAIGRFRPLPPQPAAAAWIMRHVAAHSVRRTTSGWTWKFDPRIFEKRISDRPHDLSAVIGRIGCPVSVILGGQSDVVDERDRATLFGLARLSSAARSFSVTAVDGGHHHLMLDRPDALIGNIRRILQHWKAESADF